MEEKNLGPDELPRLAAEIRRRVHELGGARPPRNVHFVALAELFRYNVHKGGFAQLLFNLRGEYIEDIEEMLLSAPAPIAHAHYMKAVQVCLEDKDGYRTFIEGDYVSENVVKDALHTVSLEYFGTKAFAEEVGSFVEGTRNEVEHWLHTTKQG